ncbi:hypothetical protein RAK27_00320 [Carnobacterium maltaromaticum]|uniref:Apea-like HEPN domain-containing protein n=1 Tax=Carnobacterium maltaromaticum TaxID=2751 RepID=A0AAW9JNN9_CARML|nr:hypothetical protein [Carnobacterium maltaromaticum]MDZ5757098.1 hypothetical protein [Carnobacterium maltaromaticum]
MSELEMRMKVKESQHRFSELLKIHAVSLKEGSLILNASELYLERVILSNETPKNYIEIEKIMKKISFRFDKIVNDRYYDPKKSMYDNYKSIFLFNRNKAKDVHTWSFKVYRKNMTALNEIYWAYVPMVEKEKYLIRNEVETDLNTNVYFHAKGPDSGRLAPMLSEWGSHIKVFSNWNRINVLLTAISNFETYLAAVSKITMESNPIICLGLPERIDGVKYLKKGYYNEKRYKDNVDNLIISFTKGTWESRAKAFYDIFADAPMSIKNNLSDLEKMRLMRNKAAHSFGQEIDKARSNRTLDSLSYDKLSESKLKYYLKLLYKIATSLDSYFLDKHIGSYEAIYYYHENYALKKGESEYNPQSMIEMKKGLTAMAETVTWSKKYVKEMIIYYHSI